MSKLYPDNDIYTIRNGVHILDGDMELASLTPLGINCEHFKNVRFQIDYTDADSPVGVISLQVRETLLADETDFVNFPLVAGMITFVTGDGALASDGTIDISGVGVGKILLNLNDPFGDMRIKYLRTSDGAADLLNVRVGAR